MASPVIVVLVLPTRQSLKGSIPVSLVSTLAAHLPLLRRHARALTGAQDLGDALVAATLDAIAANRAQLPSGVPPRLALFKAFQRLWMTSPAAAACGAKLPATPGPGPDAAASARLAALMPLPRQALLLAAMEGFAEKDVAFLLDCEAEQVQALLVQALADMARQMRASVLIIEDEPTIAMGIEAIVTGLGHEVSGVASTCAEAMAMAAGAAPGLVLADIQLRDGSTGIDAVRHILAAHPVPAIFITGYPERLLTGQRPEPAFLISKPFRIAALEAAIGQALFFSPASAACGNQPGAGALMCG